MSGFCGVFGKRRAAISDDTLGAMLRRIEHRGPDRCSKRVRTDGTAGLGHVAVASADERKEPSYVDEGIVAAVDGCVTHHPVGGAAGALEAFRREGADFAASLDGAHTLALWDMAGEQLFLSRGKLGEKSLYYYLDPRDGILIFASEIKAILRHPDVRAELDHDSLAIYLAFGYVPGPRTLFRDVHKLLPGQLLHYPLPGEPSKSKYWRLPPIADGLDDEAQCIRTLRELFLEGLERQVGNRQDVAVFLSGGVDSTIIVAGLRELGVPRIHSFTVGFKVDPAKSRKYEDLDYARLVARKFDTRHHEVVIEADHSLEQRLPAVVGCFDDLVMTPNAYSKHLLIEAVRESGLDMVLTGSAAAGACGVHRQYLDPAKRARLEQRIRDCASDEERFFRLRSRLFDLETQRRLLVDPPRIGEREMLATLRPYIVDIESADFFRLFLFSNLMITSTEKSLKVLDKIGMLSSVEARAPYLDRALVEFSTRLPASFDGGRTYVSLKTHLKKGFEDALPREVLERRVIGYPNYYWSQGELSEIQRQVFSPPALARQGILRPDAVGEILDGDTRSDAKSAGKRSWALTQLCLWHKLYVEGSPVDNLLQLA